MFPEDWAEGPSHSMGLSPIRPEKSVRHRFFLIMASGTMIRLVVHAFLVGISYMYILATSICVVTLKLVTALQTVLLMHTCTGDNPVVRLKN